MSRQRRAIQNRRLAPLEPEARRARNRAIRESIAANRAKRLAIAEAMKREAGVRTHQVWNREDEGLAYAAHGLIQSPEGRNMRQLYIVAHECGHVFLHGGELEIWMPTHIKEMEAESYAHQAFRVHGMEMPAAISEGGRRYVASWIAKDRLARLPIDPRVQAYANGTRSPYEPLRRVPQSWLPPAPPAPPPPRVAWWRRWAARAGVAVARLDDRVRDRIWPPYMPWRKPEQQRLEKESVRAVAGFAWRSLWMSSMLGLFALETDWPADVAPYLFSPGSGAIKQNVTYFEALAVGAVLACAFMLIRTMLRGFPVARRIRVPWEQAEAGSPPRPW